MKKNMATIPFIFSAVSLAIGFIYPEDLAQKLLNSPSREEGHHSPQQLNIIFTGDPQYHYPCTDLNIQCKERSRNCRRMAQTEQISIKMADREGSGIGRSHSSIPSNQQNCDQLEAEFANEIQRKCIFHLIRLLEQKGQKPAALIINGDLTNFGHHFQLELFKSEWLRTILQVPILVGLGNHDYENNVNDCVGNVCAERMLRWFSQEYVPGMAQWGGGMMMRNLDLAKRQELWKTIYEGSLAYSSRICTNQTNSTFSSSNAADQFCVNSIQLHNRPDYGASIEYPTGRWHIRGSFQWLMGELERIVEGAKEGGVTSNGQSEHEIVLINLHNNAMKVQERLHATLAHWHRLNVANGGRIRLDFMILFAHIHENHSVTIRCVNGRKVPHIFVGSVPNSRFTTIQFHPNGAEIFLCQSNANSTMGIAQMVNFQWANC